MFVAVILGVGAVAAMLAIVLVPRSGRPDDGPLSSDLETRLLLGEHPERDAEPDPGEEAPHGPGINP